MFQFFNRKYRCLFYPGAWVKRLFCKVSENLKFQMTKILKEHIKNTATGLNNPWNYYCLVYVIKSNQTPAAWWFALRGLLFAQFCYDLWVMKWLCESEFDNLWQNIRVSSDVGKCAIRDMPIICELGWNRKVRQQTRQPLTKTSSHVHILYLYNWNPNLTAIRILTFQLRM
jgi:hypothetical protein